jgi:hypothetical protein
VGSIVVDGVVVSFLHRDAKLITDDELEDIKEIVALERDSMRHRKDREVLEEIEFISDEVHLQRSRYNTVSEVTTTPEEV